MAESAAVNREKMRLKAVNVYDCRPESSAAPPRAIDITNRDYTMFLQAVRKMFSLSPNDTFVISTTDRKEIDEALYKELDDGKTLHLLQSLDQQLSASTQERIEYLPHFHTLVQCGMYEYYASEGQKALPYAFAELIDNALSATANNTGIRSIEIRLLFDEAQGGPAVVVMDNGCGMTSKQLNNWAVYRLSKFIRENSVFHGDHSSYVRPVPVPRSLNSDISYFGVGGKQAVFYIGQSVRMISKPAGSPDVHEFVMSKEEFERKEKNKEDIYSGFIRNRKPADFSHVNVSEEQFLQSIVLEEEGKESFTAVVITGIHTEHVIYLKQHFSLWTRELAHTYHYYVHGIDGNDKKKSRKTDYVPNIDIQICLFERSTRVPRVMNLRQVDNDMQTLYVNASVSTFEFKATGAGDTLVEGLIRYHPFLYDRETYPVEPNAAAPVEDEDEDFVVLNPEGRGKRPIFECFWNGRLIPYTSVSEFEWCARPKKAGPVPLECYNRISGVLFANDRFQVSTNKLTFMDLELQLRDKETIFTRVHKGQEQRVKIQKEFTSWLKECHEHFDKQVKFEGFMGVISRTDVASKRQQSPWAQFKAIKWDGKTYKTGQYVKTVKTHPIFFGSIVQFLLFGDYEGDVYATGGHMQVALEPKEVYDEQRIIPISKIDRQATAEAINKNIEDELAKLPDRLRVSWPEGNPWSENDTRSAGTPLGPIKVEILNKKGESMSRLPVNVNTKKFLIDLKVIWHSPKGDVQTNSYIGMHSSKWEYWFKAMENLSKLGDYTLHLQTILSDSSTSEWAGKRLPYYTLKFSIKEGKAVSFVLACITSSLQVGVPFSIPVEFKDAFDYPTQPPRDIKPQMECSSLELSYAGMAFGTTTVIKDVRAKGKLKNPNKVHKVKVQIQGLKNNQPLLIAVNPGPPHTLVVLPDDDIISIENGNPANFRVEVHDECQNITTQPKLSVRCQLLGAPDLPVDVVDCSNTGSGLMLTKPLLLKTINTEQIITARFNIPNHKTVACVERKLHVLPSTRVSRLEVYRQEEGSNDVMVLQNLERIDWTAGDTLGNLHFRLYDEGDRPICLTPQLTGKIKVNWTAKMDTEELSQGKLPHLCVPTQAQRNNFYHVSFHDQQVVNTSFIIVPRPDEPERLLVTLSESTVKMGETLAGHIDVIDQYGNKTDCLNSESLNSLSVSADGLDKTTLTVQWEASTARFSVCGIRFASGTPGPRELCFKNQSMEEFVRIRVTVGPPARITLLDEPEMPLQVLSGQSLNTPFALQLCDEWGNPSPDQRIVITMKTRSPLLKVKSSVMSQPVDVEGRASFLLESVSGPKGEHQLEFLGTFSKNSIPGPVVTLNVIPDPNNPVSLQIEYNREATLCAGDIFPVFTVVVVSEEGSPVKNICPASLSMLLWQGVPSGSQLWQGVPSGSHPPSTATTLKCSKQKDTDKDSCFCFRDKQIPELVGKYVVQFVLAVDKTNYLWSQQIPINVAPNKAMKLAPETPTSTPVVSNSNNRANRMLLDSLCLKIMDQYNNAAGEGIDGQVVVTVTGTEDLAVPWFDHQDRSVSYSLINGEALITDLALLENSPGVDGAEYTLHFCVEVQQSDISIIPFTLPFRFYNDVEHQKVMTTLSKKKDRLSQSILIYREILDTNKQLISELNCQVQDASKKLNELKPQIIKSGLNISELTTVSAIENVINVKKATLNKIEDQPRRKCTIPDPFKGIPEVLGKIAHLAQIEDDDAAKVISWHLLGDMDCVVTETTAAAKRIYDDTHGRQQVLPLETVFWRPNNRSLPHIRNGSPLFPALGNPVFAKDVLIFPQYVEICNKVFVSLIGDTILVDDLDSANEYRRGVVQNKAQCPTLLTRQGERIRSNGKFGGLQNKAPSIEKLRGQVFGAPLPKEYNITCTQIELLQQYSVAMQKANEVQSDYNSHLQYLQSPQMKQKQQKLQQQEEELKDIEQTLGACFQQNDYLSI
ncbi:structural maintenance of chromosomes flexible hinge domain-containing protein 1-like isoform X2 [Myxocyprinus asiaticus]|uniref:structural maintenance of chromosomes flexible hinge domain-containing protein 1-like isoform X2 n=1 Tax=Myxocyprinus asiaticus TaxID=70543 RepID=UPI00222137B7|nr:structural maintenance of chromosomes flexible hinge domain-containing protein 1-like isoform X2 [Myxocyprinus asiaticus]